MADSSVSTAVKSKKMGITSPIKASRQPLSQPKPISDGVKLPTGKRVVTSTEEAEIMRDVLASLKDVMNRWPCRMPNGEMPTPYISIRFGVLNIAFPIGHHVIENLAVTSVDGRKIHDFDVDGIPVIPVTSEENAV